VAPGIPLGRRGTLWINGVSLIRLMTIKGAAIRSSTGSRPSTSSAVCRAIQKI